MSRGPQTRFLASDDGATLMADELSVAKLSLTLVFPSPPYARDDSSLLSMTIPVITSHKNQINVYAHHHN